jgi:glycosyltransferase involved in cell wall biosynthesis
LSSNTKPSVTFFYREPRKTGYSIEGIFEMVTNSLKDKVEIRNFVCDATISRFANTMRAGKFASAVNHITGDVNFLSLGLLGKKTIITVHDLGHINTLKQRNFLQHLVYKLFWFDIPMQLADRVTVISEFSKKELLQHCKYPEEKIRVIPNPLKPLFEFKEKKKCSTTPVVLMMGSGEHKNLKNLIRAAMGTNIHLNIIGWPSEEEVALLRSGNVNHTIENRLSDNEIYERYINCDILFNASFYEGFGMPIIEAQSVGRPVITSNLGAMKEVAQDSAVLVDPSKPEEIKSAVMRLSTDQQAYENYVALGRNNASKYSVEIVADAYLKLYLELINR